MNQVSSISKAKRKVLVIDDDKEFIKIIEKYFEKIGDIELITSLDSKDAISKVLFFKPDLLIIDYYLPKANGRIIKDTFDFMLDYKIPTIFVSANNQSQLDLKKYLENPCVGFMQKPLGFVAFKDLVHQMLYDPNIKKHEVKMNSPQKPLTIMIFAGLLLLEPAFKLLYHTVHSVFDLKTVWGTLSSVDHWLNFFNVWLLFPLSGVALLFVRRWSYIVFLVLQSYAIYLHFTYEKYTWPYISEQTLLYNDFLLIFSMAMIGYFLLPEMRRPYWYKSHRNWRKSPRYDFKIPCKFTIKGKEGYNPCQLIDISIGGAFIRPECTLKKGDRIQLHFESPHFSFIVPCKIVDEYVKSDGTGYGIKFFPLQFGNKNGLVRLIKGLEHLNAA